MRCDSEQAAYQLVRLLLILGHKRVAVLAGPEDVSTAVDRVAGYRRALAEAGLRPDPRLEVHGASAPISGERMARQVLGLTPPPTAIFAAANPIAIGALKAIREAGLSVPDDIAVVAFDDLPPAWVIDPFLTAAAQPGYQIGQRAIELLLARIAKPGSNGYQDVIAAG